MAKLKYHIKNKINKRNLTKIRKNILPLELMKNDKIIPIRIELRGDSQNPFLNEII